MNAASSGFVDLRELQSEWDREQLERELMDAELERADAEVRALSTRIERVVMPAIFAALVLLFSICVVAQIAVRWPA